MYFNGSEMLIFKVSPPLCTLDRAIDWKRIKEAHPSQTIPDNGRYGFDGANSNLQLPARYQRLPTLCVQV